MILPEPAPINVKRHVPWAMEVSPDPGGTAGGIAEGELSGEERAKLLDVKEWDPILEMYGRTMKLAVALTDPEGSLLGKCHNAQPIWSAVRSSMIGKQTGCPFCLSPLSPCTAVVDALRTGLPTIVRDAAGLTHVAVPLLLDDHPLGAILAGQVPNEYPESLSLQRASKTFGISAQLLWSLSNKQRPMTRASLRLAGDLLLTLGQAFVQQRYGAILEAHAADTNVRFRLLVEGVTDYALFTTDVLGRVTSWNSGAERMLGYPEGEIMGGEFSRMFTFEDIQNGVPGKQLLKASQDRRTENEGWRVRKNGTQFWANVIITALAGESDSRPGFAMVMQDVTERRKAEIEVEGVRQERIDLQEQFLSHVSHELRTPLTAIYFFITNLLEGVNGEISPEQRETLESSLENINQLKDMVSDLLDISRVDALKLTVDAQHLHVAGLIQEVLRTCRANAKLKHINLIADITPSLPSVWADRARVRQVLINLIDNGIKFTSDRGTVVVRARVFAEDSNFLCLSVVDTGCGISPENSLTVFDRLAQVKSAEPSRKGLGLGLFISKELVTRQGGRIWVESQLREGSTFFFTLPIFSLAKLCDSLFTPANLAAGWVTLFSIDVSATDGTVPQQDLTVLQKALERCISAGRDLLLPAMTEAEAIHTFFVIACTHASGAEIISERFRRELENFYPSSNPQPSVSAASVQLSSGEQPWEERKAEAVNRIDKLIQAHVLERSVLNECKENSDHR
jgi:PAS domain S-box-containing protein